MQMYDSARGQPLTTTLFKGEMYLHFKTKNQAFKVTCKYLQQQLLFTLLTSLLKSRDTSSLRT